MFLGHYAVAFGAKKIDPKISLGTLFLSANFLDLIYPFFVLIGVENIQVNKDFVGLMPYEFYYPYSHSLIMAIVWGILVGVVFCIPSQKIKKMSLLFFLVISHWVLDFISHRPDIPVFLNGPHYGLFLWRNLILTITVEMSLFLLGLSLYVKTKGWKGLQKKWTFVLLVGLLLVIYAGSIFGPPPPNTTAFAISGLLQWLFVGWGYWFDRKSA